MYVVAPLSPAPLSPAPRSAAPLSPAPLRSASRSAAPLSQAPLGPATSGPTHAPAVRSARPDAALARVLPARPRHVRDRTVAGPAARSAARSSGASAAAGGRVPRGFALYVGLAEDEALAAGTDLRQVVERVRLHLAEVMPGSESYASVVVAPAGSGGRSIDVVRDVTRASEGVATGGRRAVPLRRPVRGVLVDLARGRVLVDGEPVGVTSTELALLRHLVLRPGQDVDRAEIVAALRGDHGPVPAPRTVDVHVRRLRAKLGEYDDVVRTVRGSGYRYDPHPDVTVEHGAPAGLPGAAAPAALSAVPQRARA